MDSPKSITLEEYSKNDEVPIVIDEETEKEVEDVCKCKQCDFETKEEKQMEIHCLTLHLVKCDGCMMHFRNNQELENHCKQEHSNVTEDTEEDSNNSSVEDHLKKKCEFLEIELAKERSINLENVKLIESQV